MWTYTQDSDESKKKTPRRILIGELFGILFSVFCINALFINLKIYSETFNILLIITIGGIILSLIRIIWRWSNQPVYYFLAIVFSALLGLHYILLINVILSALILWILLGASLLLAFYSFRYAFND